MIKKIPIVFKVTAANGLVTNSTVEIDVPQKDEDVSTEVNIPDVGPVKFNCHVLSYYSYAPDKNYMIASGGGVTINLYVVIKLFNRVVTYSGKLKTITRYKNAYGVDTREHEHTLDGNYDFSMVHLDEYTLQYQPDHPYADLGLCETTTEVECEIQITLREWTYLPVKGRYFPGLLFRSPTNGLILRDGD